MKKTLVLIFISTSLTAFAQNNNADSVSFCEKQFPIPPACATPSTFQIFCDDYSMYWFYPAKSMLSLTFKITVDGLVKGLGNCRKDSINVFLLGQKVSTIKLTCIVNGVPSYQLVSCGIVNNQAVLNILNLWVNPKRNEDLPTAIKPILRLK